jgi:hypothetical protein
MHTLQCVQTSMGHANQIQNVMADTCEGDKVLLTVKSAAHQNVQVSKSFPGFLDALGNFILGRRNIQLNGLCLSSSARNLLHAEKALEMLHRRPHIFFFL